MIKNNTELITSTEERIRKLSEWFLSAFDKDLRLECGGCYYKMGITLFDRVRNVMPKEFIDELTGMDIKLAAEIAHKDYKKENNLDE
jgi:hypothetical protein